MTTYDIDKVAAPATVQAAAKSAAGYQKDAKGLTSVLDTAEATFTHSTLVAAAVGGFMQNVAEPDLQNVSGHTNSALVGTSVALLAYKAGDEKMQRQAQRNAAKAEYPADAPGAGGKAPK